MGSCFNISQRNGPASGNWQAHKPRGPSLAARTPVAPEGALFDFWLLPEEVVDHINHAAIAQIDEQNIVIITHPAIGAVSWWKAVLIGV
jgi:hypothetical protein